jgi:DNA repair exonuclease SbcCD ATPase subunit
MSRATRHTAVVSTELSATEELARLAEKRSQAGTRIAELEQAWKTANQALADARLALVDLERRGGSSAERGKREKTLADCEAKAAEPWAERLEGARQAAHDLDQQRRQLIVEHLDELVGALEADGQAAAERLNDHARGVLDAYAEVHRIAGQISALASQVGRMQPGDVSRTRADQLARQASAVLDAGGEEPPRLKRDPRAPRHAAQIPELMTP